MAYEDYCASCTYIGESIDCYGKYNCEKKDRVYACDPKCNRYCEAYGRSNSARENMYDNSKEHLSSSGCYITTMVCAILGYPDNNYYLNTLRSFRDNYMKKNSNCIPMLLEYDVVGPKISTLLEQDKFNGYKLSYYYFEIYIKKSVKFIEEKNYDAAIKTYQDMTYNLINFYSINPQPIHINIDEIDSSCLGHGKVRKLIKKKQNKENETNS